MNPSVFYSIKYTIKYKWKRKSKVSLGEWKKLSSGHTEVANRITPLLVTRNATLQFNLLQVLSLQSATTPAIQSLHKSQDYPGLLRTQVTHDPGIPTTSQGYQGPRAAYDLGSLRSYSPLNDLKNPEGLPITRTTQDPKLTMILDYLGFTAPSMI